MSRRISDLGFRTSKPPSKPYGKSLSEPAKSEFELAKYKTVCGKGASYMSAYERGA